MKRFVITGGIFPGPMTRVENKSTAVPYDGHGSPMIMKKSTRSRFFRWIPPFIAALAGLFFLMASGPVYKLGLFLLYALAGLYVHDRLKRLLPANGPGRPVFSALLLLLALAYPLAELLSHGTRTASLKWALLPGYYALPFLLYLFLLTAAGDLLLRLGRLRRIAPAAAPAGRRHAVLAFGLLLSGSLAIVIGGRVHYENVRVNEYAAEIAARSSPLGELTIALAADFHISDLTEPRRIERIIDRINATRPDIILLPGDILEGDRKGVDVRRYAAMFRRLRATYGVYASLGNHEFHRGEWREFFDQAGIDVLDDRWTVVAGAFVLAGRGDRPDDELVPLAKVLRGAPAHLPLILLEHDPSNFDETLLHAVDIQVSGHTHHGQLFPIHWITMLKYDLSWGYRRSGRCHFFVTSGAQTWGYPVRTVGDSEIMLIRVVFKTP
jgi:predicted MPP superfamily phosphohydrolase